MATCHTELSKTSWLSFIIPITIKVCQQPLDLYMFLSDLKFRAVNGFERSQCCFAVVMNEQVTRPCHNGGPRTTKNLLIYIACLASCLTDFQELVYQIFTSLNSSEQILDKQLCNIMLYTSDYCRH